MADTAEKPVLAAPALNVLALGRAFASIRSDAPDERRAAGPDMPRLTGYTLTEKLGAGGGGVVYKGYRAGSDRALAVKLIRTGEGPRPGLDHAPQVRGSPRAWRELELLMQIRLAAVPRVIDYGWENGCLYIASEYVEGLPLDRHCQSAKLDRRERVELLARVADAVQSLHEQGVIHRDIKPSNLLIDKAGNPVIIDLGIATLLSGDVMATLTAEGAPIGSPAFMAPEQARGDRDKISTRTDVYGLGAAAFVVLTGSTPHDISATIHEAVRRVAQDPARRARELEPELARPLAAVLDKAVSARPEDRYPGAAALGADLRRWLRGEPVLAGSPGPWTLAFRWVSRHPALATAAVCVSIAVLVMGGTALATWWLSMRPHTVRHLPDGKGVDLLSRSGRSLYTWGAGPGGTISGVRLVERPAELGGGKLAIIGINRTGPSRLLEPQGLCAYLLDSPEIPLWSSGARPPSIVMPPHPNFAAPEEFTLHDNADLYDIFESPGMEVVGAHYHIKWSPTVIRIYDLAGAVRYEAWHDGFVGTTYWMPGPGLLVTCGVNSEVCWRGRGAEGLQHFPVVVMALRPVDGVRGGWISTPSRKGTIEPVWYKCLLPGAAANEFQNDFSSIGVTLETGRDPSNHFALQLVAEGGRFVSLTIDAFGEVVSSSQSAEYGQAVGPSSRLPDHRVFYLGALPAIVPGGEEFRPANR